MTYLPSTYIKYDWYWKRLNTQSTIDTLFLIIALSHFAQQYLKIISKYSKNKRGI